MASKGGFGELLARLRREQGYASARAFFLKCGGRRALGLTYANYLNLERGKSLPKVSRLERLIASLGLEDGGDLVRSYFLSLGASERLLGLLGGRAPAPERVSFTEEAARLAARKQTVHLGLAAWSEMAKDPAAHSLALVLASTKGWVSQDRLAAMTRLAPAVVRRSLRRLASLKLAKLSRGRASSPFAGRLIAPIPESIGDEWIKKALRRQLKDLVDGARPVKAYGMTIRATGRDLRRYLAHLEEAVSMSWHYEDLEQGPDSAIYHIQAKAVKLF